MARRRKSDLSMLRSCHFPPWSVPVSNLSPVGGGGSAEAPPQSKKEVTERRETRRSREEEVPFIGF